MDIAHRAVDSRGRDLENLYTARSVDEARSAADDIGIVRPVDQQVSPVVEVEAIQHQRVGTPEFQHEAGFDLDLVGVLRTAGKRVDFDVFAAHRLRQRLEIGDRGDHSELARRPRGDHGRETHQEQEKPEDQASHERLLSRTQNGCARWAPRMNVNWRNSSSAMRALASLSVKPSRCVRSVCLYPSRIRRNSDG